MPKAIVADELIYSPKTSAEIDTDFTKILAGWGYHKYTVDFNPKTSLTTWDVPKIVDAVTKCDAVFFSDRVDKDASIVKVINATAKCLGKERLYWNMTVRDYENLRHRLEWCEARFERVKDDLELLHVGAGTDIHNNIAELRKQLEEFAWYAFVAFPKNADKYTVPDDIHKQEWDNGRRALECKAGAAFFEANKHDRKRFEAILAKCQNNIR